MSWRARAWAAVAVVACLFAGAALVSRTVSTVQKTPPAPLSSERDAWAANGPAGLADRTFSQVGGAELADDGVPADFAAEVCDVETLDPTQVQAQGGVVGVVTPLAEDAARAAVRDQFGSRGWHAVAGESSQGRGDTFERDEGPYRWAFAYCQAVAGGTCVVIMVEEDA
jgi:hypothetical protein